MSKRGANDLIDSLAQVPVELPTGSLGSPTPALPVFARLDGVDVVVITTAEFRDLKALQARTIRAAIGSAVNATRNVPLNLSTIEGDADVAAFLRARFRGRTTVAALHQACVAEFGEARAPSAGRIQTFRSRWRESR